MARRGLPPCASAMGGALAMAGLRLLNHACHGRNPHGNDVEVLGAGVTAFAVGGSRHANGRHGLRCVSAHGWRHHHQSRFARSRIPCRIKVLPVRMARFPAHVDTDDGTSRDTHGRDAGRGFRPISRRACSGVMTPARTMGRCAETGPAFGVDVAMRLPLRFSDRGGVLGGHKLGPDARPVSRTQITARHGAVGSALNGYAVLW